MNKILLAFFIFNFFLDFSFIPSLLGSSLSWPYFTISFLVAMFLFEDKLKNIYWGGLGIITLSILTASSIVGSIMMVGSIWVEIYFLENIFFNKQYSFLKSNTIFVISFLLFIILLFVGENVNSKFTGSENIWLEGVNFLKIAIKFFIGIIVFNLTHRIVYKLCVKDTRGIKV